MRFGVALKAVCQVFFTIQSEGHALKKICVFIGNYGSGKTELAINFALDAAKTGKTELIDLDLLNPCFRLSERRELVEAAGVRLVAPNYASTNVETMSLSPEVFSAFDMEWDTVVFDVGGDATGATALGRFKKQFAESGAETKVLCVVNVRRPQVETAEKIIAHMAGLEQASRLKITGLVNNANLAAETTENDLLAGYEALREVSSETGVPVIYTAGMPDVLGGFLKRDIDMSFVGAAMTIKRYMRRDWDGFTGKTV